METAHWQITVEHRKEAIPTLEALWEEEALSIASFELDEKANLWRTTVLLAEKPTSVALKMEGVLSEAVIEPLMQKDWVAENQASFTPQKIGRFLILGTHHEGVDSTGKIELRLDAGAAFGTGSHATTEGCLRALEYINKTTMGQTRSENRASPELCAIGAPVGAHGAQTNKILDMGCGSGILGIAAAKLCPAGVLGVEIDPVATAVAVENVKRNRVAARCRMITGNGYQCPEVGKHAPYDVIFANILAKPLVQFAPALAQNLAPGGYAILSGLLNTQANWVLSAHRAQGLALARRIVIDDWTTLVIRKN